MKKLKHIGIACLTIFLANALQVFLSPLLTLIVAILLLIIFKLIKIGKHLDKDDETDNNQEMQ